MSYATLNDLRTFLGYPAAVTADDTLLASALSAAEEAVDDFCGRTFGAVSASAARIFDGGSARVLIDDAATVTLVEESSDRSTWSTVTGSWLEPANSTPKTTLVNDGGFARFVRVTGTWGYGSTPERVSTATLIKAAALFKRKDSPRGVEGFGEFGVVRISNREDPDVVALLAKLRRVDRTMGLA